MKTIILTLLILPALSWANTPELPEGLFDYSETEVYSTSHQRILNLRHSKDKKTYNELRDSGYQCSLHPNSFSRCKKIVEDNPNQIEFNVERLKALSPNFGSLIAAGLVNESELVDTYEIDQTVDFQSSSTETYKAYVNHQTEKLYLDIKTKTINPIRFEYVNSQLINFSTEKEKVNKNEFYIHTIVSVYE